MSIKKLLEAKLNIIKKYVSDFNKNQITDENELLANIDTIRNDIYNYLDLSVSNFPDFAPKDIKKIYFPLINSEERDEEYIKKCNQLHLEKFPELQKFLTDSLSIIRKHNNSLFYLNTSSKHRKIDDIVTAIEGYFKSLKFTSNDPDFVIHSDSASNSFLIPGLVTASNSSNIRFENVVFRTSSGTTRIDDVHWDTKSVQNINLNGRSLRNIAEWLNELVNTISEIHEIYPD